jgi:copper(I)-binding protein
MLYSNPKQIGGVRVTHRKLALVFLFFSNLAVAEGLEFNQGWSREIVPGAKSAAIYGRFINLGGKDLSVQHITSEVAGMLMIHRSILEDGMMKMRHVEQLVVRPGETIVLEPGGLHIMLSGLNKGLLENDTFNIKITTNDGGQHMARIIVGSIGQMNVPE